MSHIPKVSVCIPTYNRSQYLHEAIESVLMQSFTDFELVICDNASIDDTSEVVNSFCDDRIKYHRNQENLGAFKNINLCLELARGEYITIFHDDDVMLQNNLLIKVNFLEMHPNIGMVGSNTYRVDDSGNTMALTWEEDIESNLVVERKFKTMFLENNAFCFSAVLCRRKCYLELGEFEEIPYCDWEMWMRISLFYDLAHIQKPLIKYRVHGGSDHLNYIGFREGYEAKMSIVNKYASKIPEVEFLKHDMQKNMCLRIVDFSFSNLRRSYKNMNMFCSLIIFSASINLFASTTYIFFKLFGFIRRKIKI